MTDLIDYAWEHIALIEQTAKMEVLFQFPIDALSSKLGSRTCMSIYDCTQRSATIGGTQQLASREMT